MNKTVSRKFAATTLFTVAVLVFASLIRIRAAAQNPELQERLAAIKQASAENKQAVAQYTWQEQDTISIKGDVKKQELFQVRMGPDGKPQKTPLDAQPPQQQQSGRRGRLKEHVVEKKTEEFKDYAQQIGTLAHAYAQPDPQKLQQAFQQGNLTLGSAGAPNEVRIVVTNYIKPNDSVTIVFDKVLKAIQGVQIATYLDSPSDAVKIGVQFAQLPNGPNHVATMNVEGVSKQLTVAVQNSNYQKM